MENKVADVLIIGGGAAGLTSAIYCGRAGLKTVLCESGFSGGKIISVNSIENYPGFSSVNGFELAEKMKEQALNSGVEIKEFLKTEKVNLKDKVKNIYTDSTVFEAKCVIIATGSQKVLLDVKNEEKFHGNGVHYCAECDGFLYKNKTVAVTGGGSSAVSAAIYLSESASKVLMIRRKDSFHCEKILLDRLKKISNIQILYNWNITDLLGEDKLIGIEVQNTRNNTRGILSADGVFVFNGSRPSTELFKDVLSLDSEGYIFTDENMCTNIPGVFAAGDVRSKLCRQITTATADGTAAAYSAEKYIHGQSEFTVSIN